MIRIDHNILWLLSCEGAPKEAAEQQSTCGMHELMRGTAIRNSKAAGANFSESENETIFDETFNEKRKDTMEIRQGRIEELPRLMEIYASARAFMASHGNPHQWGDNQWPPEDKVREDIRLGRCFVCEQDGRVHAVFSLLYGKDVDPTYLNIEDGEWKDDSAYGVIHKLASDGSVPGTGEFCLNWAYERCGQHLRVDTHGDNLPMQNIFKRLGFTHCGTIYVEQDDYPRLAYEKSVKING